MRYIIGFVFLFLGVVGFAQVERTAGIAIGTTVPTHTPSAQGALKYYNRSSGVSYRWTGSAWTVETVDLSGYLQWSDTSTLATKHYVDSQGFLTAEVDGSITNEIQDLSISGTTLSLSGDASTVDLSGIGLISSGVAGYLVQYTGATSQDTISAYWDATTGRLGVGIASLLLARLHVKGPSTTSSTTALLVENSAGTDHFEIKDNGSFYIRNTTFADQAGIIYKNNVRFLHNFEYGNNGVVTVNGFNTFLGIGAGNLTMGSTATVIAHSSSNTGIGYNSLTANTTGYENTAIGINTLDANTTGIGNNAFGIDALGRNTTGLRNVAMGRYAVFSNLGGSDNTGAGGAALYRNTSGTFNTAIGSEALFGITTTSNNTGIGKFAGSYLADGTTENATASNSTFIGYDTKAAGAGQTNQNVFGGNTVGLGSNTTRIGNSSTIQTHLDGSLTLGSTTPAASALITMTSTTQGLLPPRMTTVQRDAISSPATGLMLFCTDCTATDGSTGVSQTYSSGTWKNHY